MTTTKKNTTHDELSPVLLDTLDAIRTFRSAHDCGPTYEELAVLLRVSKPTIQWRVGRLIEAGRVTKTGGSRSLAVTRLRLADRLDEVSDWITFAATARTPGQRREVAEWARRMVDELERG